MRSRRPATVRSAALRRMGYYADRFSLSVRIENGPRIAFTRIPDMEECLE